jgi:hypothetical protein
LGPKTYRAVCSVQCACPGRGTRKLFQFSTFALHTNSGPPCENVGDRQLHLTSKAASGAPYALGLGLGGHVVSFSTLLKSVGSVEGVE